MQRHRSGELSSTALGGGIAQPTAGQKLFTDMGKTVRLRLPSGAIGIAVLGVPSGPPASEMIEIQGSGEPPF